ncbi:MAG: O-antigen ligase family protein [Candidatus Saccharibacteria bacterium]
MVDGIKYKNNKLAQPTVVGMVYVGILLVIFGGIVLHTPITVFLESMFPSMGLLIKSWKETLMIIAGLVAIYLVVKNQRVVILKHPIILTIGAYIVLHLVMTLLNLNNLIAVGAGLAIDLRYIIFFVLVFVAISLYPQYRKLFIKLGVIGALLVLVFAILQVFVLPYDILRFLGYGKQTILPYLTVDQNYSFIRINSILRGPNVLGSYAVIVASLVAAFVIKNKINGKKYLSILIVILSVGTIVALWASYSRSALVAAILAVGTVLFVVFYKKISARTWVIAGSILLVTFGGFFAFRDTYFVSNVLLHENPGSDITTSSNEGHISSLQDGFSQLLKQPLGAGVGSTGSASLYGNKPEIIENQYLFTAHEAGWIGLALFLSIFIFILVKLWHRRSDWLALGVFASGLGLALIGLLLPVWVDDTVSIIWWGMAAIALFMPIKDYN